MEKFAILEVVEGFPLRILNIGQRRAPVEVGPTQAAFWHSLGPARASRSTGQPPAPLWPIFGDPEASVSLIFFYFFWMFSAFGKLGKSPCKIDISRQKLALGALS